MRRALKRPIILLSLVFIASSLFLSFCKTPKNRSSRDSLKTSYSLDERANKLNWYEAWQIRDLKANKDCGDFKPEVGVFVTQRNSSGEAVEGYFRVLVDRSEADIYIQSSINNWGQGKNPEDKLEQEPGTPYYRSQNVPIKHGMQYRYLVNGDQLLDPAASLYTTQSLFEEQGETPDKPYLNSVFWDYVHPGHYETTAPAVDLRSKIPIIAESEVMALVGKWEYNGRLGPSQLHDTYKFVATSGIIDYLKKSGYNAIEFLPFNASLDGDQWHLRYQVFGLFAPDSRYGNPDEFAMMIDAFNRAGMVVIMDAVVGHYPYKGNSDVRSIANIGPHRWKKENGNPLFGNVMSPWDTYRYDYANPHIRRFLTDSIMNMMCRYNIGGIRFDNFDGIRLYEGPGGGGTEFVQGLVKEIRSYRPESLLIGEMFFGYNAVVQAISQNGFGINFRTHSDFFDFLKDNLLKSTEQVDIERLRNVIRMPWEWNEATRVQYLTNHDEAANGRDGATGSYVATLLKGGDWYYVERKTIAFGSLTMLSSMAYLDMPQLRLLQEGTFSNNPTVDWTLLKSDSQRAVFQYFSDLSNIVKDEEAFAIQNYHPNIENTVDTAYGNRVITMQRINFESDKHFYIIINLGHQSFENYKVGVNLTGDYTILIDSDDKKYRGSGRLTNSVANKILTAENAEHHGKPYSFTLPYLGPYTAVLVKKN